MAGATRRRGHKSYRIWRVVKVARVILANGGEEGERRARKGWTTLGRRQAGRRGGSKGGAVKVRNLSKLNMHTHMK